MKNRPLYGKFLLVLTLLLIGVIYIGLCGKPVSAEILPTTSYTDPQTKNNLIISSDQKDYFNLTGAIESVFSITNQSGIDQNINILINITNGSWDKIYQNYGYDPQPEKINIQKISTTSIKGSSSPTSSIITNEEQLVLEDKIIWSELPIRDFMDSRSVYIHLPANETKIFKAHINTKLYNNEFTIEAYGDQGGYGYLDPWTYTQNFDSLLTTDLNGQDSWSGDTHFDVQATTYIGVKAVEVNAGAGYSITRNITSTDTGILTGYMRNSDSGSKGIGYLVLRDNTGSRIAVRMNANNFYVLNSSTYIDVGDYSPNVWYKITIDFNATAKTYDVYIDDTLVADDYSTYSARTDNITKLVFDIDGSGSYIYYDEFTPGSLPSSGGSTNCNPFPIILRTGNSWARIPILVMTLIILFISIYVMAYRFSKR